MNLKKPENRPTICANCTYWKRHEGESLLEQAETGECKRFPPQIILTDDGNGVCIRPSTGFKDFCGEYQPRIDA